MKHLSFRIIGDSLRLITPKKLVSRNLKPVPRKSQFEKAMDAYSQVSSKYRNALAELAK